MAPRAAIVFDLDGTLVDSHLDIANATNATLRRLGRPPRPPEVLRGFIGDGVHHLLGRALDTTDGALIETARLAFGEEYAARLTEHTALYPGVREALTALAEAGFVLAVATNKPAAFTRTVAERLGFAALGLRALASADEAGARKPDPAVLALALSRAAVVGPGPVSYVGDLPVDVETARRFGARSVGAGWGFGPEALAAARPDLWLDRPEDLVALKSTWADPTRGAWGG